MTDTTGNTTESEIFIPSEPDQKRRFGLMISQALPGFMLILSVVGTQPDMVGALLLNAFCIIAGSLLVFFSVREYKFPGKGKKPGIDSVMVFSGLIIIAQGAQVFDAPKGFQPAHLYFLAGAIFIFKGVMFPESKIKRGFIISENSIEFRDSLFKSSIKLSRENLPAPVIAIAK